MPDADELSTVRQGAYDPSPLPDVAFVVEVVAGPDRGLTVRIDGSTVGRVLVGQSPACGLRLKDRAASRRHASLEIVGNRLRVIDLGSTNGTFVERVAISDAYLEGREHIALGGTTLRVSREAPQPAQTVPTATSFGRVLGASREMRHLYPLCARLAALHVPVIIEGETGTGKEVLAESLHELGPRSSAPFVVFDCTAVPPTLLESELFGHERGSFTGASATRKGVFEQAQGGTLLIDEIGDLELSLQPKLLRAIERSEVRRVGGDRWLHVDVRVIAATRRDLDREIQAGRFRDDLFHRLAVARLELPPLRSRKGDITLLARWFARGLGGPGADIPPDVLRRWEEAPWPGNVRQLRNAVARQLALGDLASFEEDPMEGDDAATPLHEVRVPDAFLDSVLAEGLPLLAARRKVVAEFHARYVEKVLSEHGGSVAHAAAASGIARRYFQLLRARKGR
jgi:DNA-binding NtrC family response regulator